MDFSARDVRLGPRQSTAAPLRRANVATPAWRRASRAREPAGRAILSGSKHSQINSSTRRKLGAFIRPVILIQLALLDKPTELWQQRHGSSGSVADRRFDGGSQFAERAMVLDNLE